MTADVRFIAHTAQSNANKVAAHRLGNALTQRCFAHTRWAHKAEDRPGPTHVFFAEISIDHFQRRRAIHCWPAIIGAVLASSAFLVNAALTAMSRFSFITARYSMIRRLTLSRSK